MPGSAPWQRCRGLVGCLWLVACTDPALEVALDGGMDAEAGPSADAPADTPGPFDLRPKPIALDAPLDGRRACEVVVTEGPDLGVPMCPQAVPTEGAECQPLVGWGHCWYPNGCDSDEWHCRDGRWKRTPGRSCSACPAEKPVDDSSCAELGETRRNFLCHWPRATGGGYSYGSCVNCRWNVGNVNNDPSCPPALPKAGDPCPAPNVACEYASACHGRDGALCREGRWEVHIGSCN